MNVGRFLLLVTGASRGFGRCVAEEFVRQVAPARPVDLVLVARSESGLRGAADAIDEIARGIRVPAGSAAADVVVRIEPLDLGDLDRLEGRLEGVFSRIGESLGVLEIVEQFIFATWSARDAPRQSIPRPPLLSSFRVVLLASWLWHNLS